MSLKKNTSETLRYWFIYITNDMTWKLGIIVISRFERLHKHSEKEA